MQILFITQYFPPEIEIGGNKVFEISKKLQDENVSIVVLTGYPNFPSGKIFPGYNNREVKIENIESISTIRIPIYPNHSLSVFRRMLNQVSFLLSGLINISKVPKTDIVIATSPPLFVGLLGFLISKIKKSRFIFEVRDLWPESAIQVGLIKQSWVTRIFDHLQRYLYAKCHHAVALTEGVKQGLSGSKSGLKCTVIRNGVDTDLFNTENKLRNGNSFDDKIKLGYIGTLSLIHGIDVLISVAERLKSQNIDIHITGDGVEKQRLFKSMTDRRMDHVFFYNPVSKTDVPQVINKIDIGLVTVKNIAFCNGTVPAKLFEYWACGKPVILAVEGEAEKIAKEADAAICVKPEDGVAIANAAIKLRNDKKLRNRLGRNGRKYVLNNSSREISAQKYYNIFNEINTY